MYLFGLNFAEDHFGGDVLGSPTVGQPVTVDQVRAPEIGHFGARFEYQNILRLDVSVENGHFQVVQVSHSMHDPQEVLSVTL